MAFEQGERYHCAGSACRCEVEVTNAPQPGVTATRNLPAAAVDAGACLAYGRNSGAAGPAHPGLRTARSGDLPRHRVFLCDVRGAAWISLRRAKALVE